MLNKINSTRSARKFLTGVLILLASSVVYAFSYVWCFDPNGIAFGGLTGVAQIINLIFPVLPVGIIVIILNIPLFLLGWKFIGGKLLVSSLATMFLTSVFIDVLNALFDWQPMDPLLASIFGGVVLGVGLGFIFRQGATTGGTDLAARLLKLKLTWLSVGRLLMGIDLVVIVLVAIFFRSINTALYGIIALYISTLVMDGILYGMDKAKVAYIISDYNEEICSIIVEDLERGVTILQGQGAYTGDEKKVLMCAFKEREITFIRDVVKQTDPDAFLIVCDANEVLGDGFRQYRKNDV